MASVFSAPSTGPVLHVTGAVAGPDIPLANPIQSTPPPYTTMGTFASALNPAGTQLVYSTYLGGSAWSGPGGIASDGQGTVTIVGATANPNLPISNHYYENGDVFVLRIGTLAPAVLAPQRGVRYQYAGLQRLR